MGALAERPLRTTVVGGGPGGLFYAALAKRRFPHHEVVVHERNPADATFGFGVVFSEKTLSGFAEADPALHADIARASVDWEDIELRRGGRRLRCGGHGFSAISRKALLGLLQDRAREAGADLRFESEVGAGSVTGADLILAADGVNSTIRAGRQAAFGSRFEVGAARYIWFATPQSFDALTFIFAENKHGHFAVHAYPFEHGTSTFIVETDEASWRRAGLDQAGDLPPGASDMASLHYCEDLFAEHLRGHGLLENNSRWLQFRTLRCDAWHDGNIAVIGDAAHTAHFSVGSGTKMAMEDAVALADAIAAAPAIDEALTTYEADRRPQVARIQAAAAPSLVWWERFAHLAGRPDEEFAFHFLSRSPSITRGRLKARDFRFVRKVERWYASVNGGDVADGPLAAPFAVGSVRLPSRLVVAPRAGRDPLIVLGGAAVAGAGLVLASPCDDLDTVRDWVHEQTEAVVGVRLDGSAGAEDLRRAVEAGLEVLAIDATSPLAAEWPAGRPLIAIIPTVPEVEGPEGDALVAGLSNLGRARIVLAGIAPPAETVSDPLAAQLMLCDRLKQETGLATVLIDGAFDADAAATAVMAGRADLVAGMPSLVSECWEQTGLAGPPTELVASART